MNESNDSDKVQSAQDRTEQGASFQIEDILFKAIMIAENEGMPPLNTDSGRIVCCV
jgi:hypothetical protein